MWQQHIRSSLNILPFTENKPNLDNLSEYGSLVICFVHLCRTDSKSLFWPTNPRFHTGDVKFKIRRTAEMKRVDIKLAKRVIVDFKRLVALAAVQLIWW
ncbi:hypothetical protein E2C01_086990 [Portunus trituberculatus]|uniref:Uncharacterized protein n=1 Tax=Portunus trituberculatus TaxID=210409 RepID=A0A5B7JB70_PORTR|nr:hypothetical protein [Portunus trituberculatus]